MQGKQLSPAEMGQRKRNTLEVLRGYAKRGERCPTNEQLSRDLMKQFGHPLSHWHAPAELAYLGLLRTEVYAKNYRVIEIDGMRTAEEPAGRKPYLVIEHGKRKEMR